MTTTTITTIPAGTRAGAIQSRDAYAAALARAQALYSQTESRGLRSAIGRKIAGLKRAVAHQEHRITLLSL